MSKNQMLGVVVTLLLVLVILPVADINQRHHTVGDSIHEAVEDLTNS